MTIKYIVSFQLFEQRSKIAVDEGADVWKLANSWAMSDIEEDEDGPFFRTLPWRTEELSLLIREKDASAGLVRRYGEPSARRPNENCSGFVQMEYEEQ